MNHTTAEQRRSCCGIAVAANHTETVCDPFDNTIPVSRMEEVGIAELDHKPAGEADYKSVEVDRSCCTWWLYILLDCLWMCEVTKRITQKQGESKT